MTEQAIEKLKKESEAGKFNRHAEAMKRAVVKALKDFCRQSEAFAESVVRGGSFEECMAAVSKNVGNSISDLEAYKRAVKFYMKDAEIRFRMEITAGEAGEPASEDRPVEQRAPEIIDLSAFL